MPRTYKPNGRGTVAAYKKGLYKKRRGEQTGARALAIENKRKISIMEAVNGGENKFVDYNVADKAFTTGWTGGEMDNATALALSAVAQGDTGSSRDGRVYYINSIHVRGFIHLPAAESQTGPQPDVLARLALVWDTQTNNGQLNAEDVYVTVGAGEDVNSFRNLKFSKRFIVLKDKEMRVYRNQTNEGAANLFAANVVQIPFNFNKKFSKPIKVRASTTAATVAAITDNSLHLIGTSTSTALLLTYESRCRFSG